MVANRLFGDSQSYRPSPTVARRGATVIARLNHFTRSHTSVLTLSLPLIGLMIGGVLSELIVFHINKARLVRVRTHKCAGANDLPESALP